jgi:hypothetical protein
MKYSFIIAILLVTSSAINLVKKNDDEEATAGELDALMDKYDDTDAKKLNKTT